MFNLINYTIPVIFGGICGFVFVLLVITLMCKFLVYAIDYLYDFWINRNE